MTNIKRAFQGHTAFIPFVTAGDPDLQTTKELILAMAKAGADLIEIGIPFSDPVAEGPVIQRADLRALAAGTTTDCIFEMVEEVQKCVQVPLAFMTYINPIFTYGKERFVSRCAKSGISAIIIPDLPYEEKGELQDVCSKYHVALISLVSQTSKERIKKIASEAEGFLYCVSSMGVTGVRSSFASNLEEMLAAVKEVSSIPCAVGFGVSTPEQAKNLSKLADGVIVGSAIVKLVEQYGKDCIPHVTEYIKAMKQAME